MDRELVLEKLKEWGVMSDLSILTQVISKHVDKLEYDDDDSNSTRGNKHYDLVTQDMCRVTLTGDFMAFQGSNLAANLDQLAPKSLQESRDLFLGVNNQPNLYSYRTYNGVKCWQVKDLCTVIHQSAFRFGGIDKIRWEGTHKPIAVAKTRHYVQPALINLRDLNSENDKDIQTNHDNQPLLDTQASEGSEGGFPLCLPILVMAYEISPEGKFNKFVLGLPAPVERRSQNPWVWTIDLLAYAASSDSPSVATSAQEVQPTPSSKAPAVPDAHVKLKKAAE
jgi:hypothetical protein